MTLLRAVDDPGPRCRVPGDLSRMRPGGCADLRRVPARARRSAGAGTRRARSGCRPTSRRPCSNSSGAPRSPASSGTPSTPSSTRASAGWPVRSGRPWPGAGLAPGRWRPHRPCPGPCPSRPGPRLRPGAAHRRGGGARTRTPPCADPRAPRRDHRAVRVGPAPARDERPRRVPAWRQARPTTPSGGRWIVLVDDVLTTGATLSACASVLMAAGATGVSAVTVARER